MVSPTAFIRTLRKDAQSALDPDASSVSDELKALDWQLSELARIITEIEGCNPSALVTSQVKRARRHLDTAASRSYRAQKIDQGTRVTKA